MIRFHQWRRWALMLCIPLSMVARADEAPAPAPAPVSAPSGTLDQCLAKAAAARPGIITGWQELSSTSDEGYYVRIVSKDGGIGLTECRPASEAPLDFTKKTGLVRYEMYERVKVAEPAARAVAPAVFLPPVKFTRMELSISVRGSPYYTYTLTLPGGQQATVEVDAVSGKPITAKVKY